MTHITFPLLFDKSNGHAEKNQPTQEDQIPSANKSLKKSKEPLRGVSVVAVMAPEGKLLMGKRNSDNRWTNPGGSLNEGEDPLDGAIRELREETGIKVTPSKLKYLGSGKAKNGHDKIIYVYKYDGRREFSVTHKHDPDDEVKGWKYIDISKGLPKKVKKKLHSTKKNILLDKLKIKY